jgi:5-methylcytosine-specific restriction endonuclease McrA
MRAVQCVVCKSEFQVLPYREKTAKFCSYKCQGEWRKTAFVGEGHPRWSGGKRTKPCQHCGKLFGDGGNITTFRKRKFCSKGCADQGGFRYSGETHPNYREDARRKNRGGSHHKWVNAVISRDMATCQHCGAKEVELHAHHIKSYRDHPELRFDVANGITLCYSCHWSVHTALNAKAVNSVNTRPGKAEGNTEPSFGRKPVEGVTTRGRAYRRWFGECDFCKKPISKRFSDVKGKKWLFCSYSCSARWKVAQGIVKGRTKAVTSSKSAAPEREDIV